MKRSLAILAAVVPLLAGLSPATQAQVSVPDVVRSIELTLNRTRVPNGGTAPLRLRYILIDPGNAVLERDGFPPLERVAVLVMFIGGDGAMGFTPGQLNTGSPNPVARNRYHFAAEGYVVAVVDAATDFNASGIGLRNRRFGAAHLSDLTVLMADLRAKYPTLPIWAVGHSRGTLSAGVMATMLPPVTETGAVVGVADGLVLLSSLTGDPANVTEDLSRVDLESVHAPVLIGSHLGDSCAFTNPDDSRALRKRFIASERAKFRALEGGSTPISDPCDPLAPHGFFGIDQKLVDAVTKWIRRRED
jgi:pimeloyl-ACP methyl ester carboxylesterase